MSLQEDPSKGGLTARMRTLERLIDDLQRRLEVVDSRDDRLEDVPQWRFGHTVSDAVSYPTAPATVFEFRLDDWSYVETVGNQAPTIADRGHTLKGLSLDGFLEEGQRVRAVEYQDQWYLVGLLNKDGTEVVLGNTYWAGHDAGSGTAIPALVYTKITFDTPNHPDHSNGLFTEAGSVITCNFDGFVKFHTSMQLSTWTGSLGGTARLLKNAGGAFETASWNLNNGDLGETWTGTFQVANGDTVTLQAQGLSGVTFLAAKASLGLWRV